MDGWNESTVRSTPHRRHHHHHHRHRRLLYSFLFKSLPFPSHKLTSAPEPRLVSSRSRPGVIMTRRSWRRWRCWPRSDSGGRSAFRSERQKKKILVSNHKKKKVSPLARHVRHGGEGEDGRRGGRGRRLTDHFENFRSDSPLRSARMRLSSFRLRRTAREAMAR